MSERVDRLLVARVLDEGLAGGRVLNLPAGDGELSRALDAAGVSVTSADLFPEVCRFRPEDAVRADMNGRLPFEDGSFDGLVCQEGIEHLEDVAGFLGECRRVLREGGLLLVTTPNFLDLSSRLSFFLTGLKSFRSTPPNEESTLWGAGEDGRLYHGHAFTLPYFQIRYLMRLQQFDEVEVGSLADSSTSRGLFWVMRPWMGPLVRRSIRRRCARDRRDGKPSLSDGVRQELERQSLSRDLLCAKSICVRAIRREGSFRPPARIADR